MSGYSFRNTPLRKLAREMYQLKKSRPPITSVLTRADTGIRNIYEKSLKTGATRDEIEEENVMEQCLNVLKPPVIGKTVCWLCGFFVQGLPNPSTPPNYRWSAFMDQPVCEHVLPVRLASLITGLYSSAGGFSKIGSEKLLHSVYEYAHVLCNLAKSNSWFITKPDKTRPSYCDLEVSEEKINLFLERLYYFTSSPTGRYPYSIYPTENSYELEVDRYDSGIYSREGTSGSKHSDNHVQYYVKQTYSSIYGDDEEAMKKAWMTRQKEIILEKMKRLVDYIKAHDRCGMDDEGFLYEQTQQGLRNLQYEGTISRGIGPAPYFFPRSSSVESIDARHRDAGLSHPRIAPSSTNAATYPGERSKKAKPIAKSRRNRRSLKARAESKASKTAKLKKKYGRPKKIFKR
jgi:hypothetical protein